MRLLGRFLPPLAVMGLIFFLSAQPDLKSGLGLADLIARKVLHAAEYGLLWWLWLRALGWRAPGWAAGITLGYAASDEFHQAFVEARVGSPLDWLIDAAGVTLAWWLWRRVRRGSDPAALGRDEHGLRPVDRAQLPVDVVEVGANGGGRE